MSTNLPRVLTAVHEIAHIPLVNHLSQLPSCLFLTFLSLFKSLSSVSMSLRLADDLASYLTGLCMLYFLHTVKWHAPIYGQSLHVSTRSYPISPIQGNCSSKFPHLLYHQLFPFSYIITSSIQIGHNVPHQHLPDTVYFLYRIKTLPKSRAVENRTVWTSVLIQWHITHIRVVYVLFTFSCTYSSKAFNLMSSPKLIL